MRRAFMVPWAILYAYFNVYPLIRLQSDGLWGSSGTGFFSSYGFPLHVASSAGCFSGPQLYPGNFFLDLCSWAGAFWVATALARRAGLPALPTATGFKGW